MTDAPRQTALSRRALVRVEGEDWRPFLQGLITQDVEGLQPGDLRYGALLTPQGRLLFDLFLWADEDAAQAGATLEVDAAGRDSLVARLSMYRLRAKVRIEAAPGGVFALFPGGAETSPGPPWRPDPRLAAIGWRAIGEPPPSQCALADEAAYESLRIALGLPDVASDNLSDRAYAVEADLDLLNGIDFRKGCFVGQETTSRMKRRGAIKTRLVPLAVDGAAPEPGAEVLAGELRAGEICAAAGERALALVRIDRARRGGLMVEGRAARLAAPGWLADALAEVEPGAEG